VGRKEYIIDPADVDFDDVVADVEEIRKYNPQRFEMEQLTGIVYEDADEMLCAGFKDITEKEVWVRGHMPNMPLMPGVFMCEAAAQVCSYVTQKFDLLGADMVGFGSRASRSWRSLADRLQRNQMPAWTDDRLPLPRVRRRSHCRRRNHQRHSAPTRCVEGLGVVGTSPRSTSNSVE